MKFVTQAYRETFLNNKRSLVQEIRLFANQHGHFVAIHKNDLQQYEVAFAKEPGFLLGECVWHFFSKPSNLIFCEETVDRKQLFLVVVRDGSIYLDTQIAKSQLFQELLPLTSDSKRYRIIISGNITFFSNPDQEEKFPKHLIYSVERISEPLLQRLPPLKIYQLKPYSLALKNSSLKSYSHFFIIAGFILIIIMWLFNAHNTPSTVALQSSVEHPISAVAQALQKPSSTDQLKELNSKLAQLYLLPGWRLNQIKFNGSNYDIRIEPNGGNIELLRSWCEKNNYQLLLNPTQIGLQTFSQLKPRRLNSTLPPSQTTVSILIDQINRLLQGQAVQLVSQQDYINLKEIILSIKLKSVSPMILDLIGSELRNYPLTLNSVDLNVQQGLLNGQIQLSLWGT